MSVADISALATGIAGVIGAVTALVMALRGSGTAAEAKTTALAAHAAVLSHVETPHCNQMEPHKG